MAERMRGFFGIGVESGDKSGNLGNLMRTAHGFGASFLFTVGRDYNKDDTFSDTSRTDTEVPLFRFENVDSIMLPERCVLVGVELTEDAIDLPSFTHPRQAAYVLGRERGSLTPEMLARCAHVIRIPTSFCLNQATAGAVVMYDRVRMLGRWPVRPVTPRGEPTPMLEHRYGDPIFRLKS
jgi:tRNA(Leu) C34 or U34 (ribose-2'-O)-methylase TrmL